MLIRFELQKLYSKRSNLIVFLLLLALIGYSSYQAIRSVEWVDTHGNWETGYSAAQKLRQARGQWSGTLNQEMLEKGLETLKEIYSSAEAQSSNIEENWVIRNQLQGVGEIADLLSWSYAETYGSFEKMVSELQPEDLWDFYANRTEERKEWLYDKSSWAYYNYAEQEKQYITKQYEAMEVPLQLSYHEGWVQANEHLPSLLKYSIILLSFLLAGIFSDEFTLKTAAVYYNTFHGRTKATATKIALGFLSITAVYWISVGIYSIAVLDVLGTDGATCLIQSHSGYWFLWENMTFLQKYFLSLTAGYIGYLFIGFLVMWISAKTKSSVLAVLIPSLVILLPEYLGVDHSSFMFYAIGILPDRLLDFSGALSYLVLYPIGNHILTSWTIILAVYPCVTILLLFLCYREYRHKQIA